MTEATKGVVRAAEKQMDYIDSVAKDSLPEPERSEQIEKLAILIDQGTGP